MLKKNALRRICISTFSLFIVLLLCIFPSNETSYPEEIISINELTMPLYIKDQNGYVARTNIVSCNCNDIDKAKDLLDSLTIGGKKSNIIPNGFRSIIPPDTSILNIELKDKILTIDFSKEFLDVSEVEEEKMIESIIYTLTSIKGIDKIIIKVEGNILTNLPHSKKIIPSVLDRSYGINKDKVLDLLIFYSSKKKDFITLKEYVDFMKNDQKEIYYACGETVEKIDLLPQVEMVKEKDFDILYLTDYADEFTIGAINTFMEKTFKNVCDSSLDLDTKDEKEELSKLNEESKDMLSKMKDILKDKVSDVKITDKLKNHPVCLTSNGAISTQMEKVINAMPNSEKVSSSLTLEINDSHPILAKLKDLYKDDEKQFEKYTKVLYAQSKLIEGLPIDNPTELSNLVCDLLSK